MPHTNSKEWLKRNKLPSKKPSGAKNPSGSTGFKLARRPRLVEYDEKDRYEYLTGFSARKKAGKAAALERASQRAREEKLEFRRQLKDARLSKIKEAIDQQTEWYGIDAFEGQQNLETGGQVKPTRVVEKFVEKSAGGAVSQSHTTTTVTIEPLEVDHSVLMANPDTRAPASSHSHYQPHPDRNFHKISSSSSTPKPPPHDRTDNKPRGLSKTSKPKSNNKTNKKKKIPYESKATRSIERVKKQAKRDSKSKKASAPLSADCCTSLNCAKIAAHRVRLLVLPPWGGDTPREDAGEP
ncbi:hypothetical protein PCANC_20719 [Puccinia coronata f. sp. avenae]|uniref:Uncharacterized protein n=1 Tax=Puccinia coronata f. sp. avenae TaxID=200324 RepID=A0A2N5SAV8_9BASI|nr:hypothetical protein PCANC_20719 [Puccinia coronata f. sp. avenae]